MRDRMCVDDEKGKENEKKERDQEESVRKGRRFQRKNKQNPVASKNLHFICHTPPAISGPKVNSVSLFFSTCSSDPTVQKISESEARQPKDGEPKTSRSWAGEEE